MKNPWKTVPSKQSFNNPTTSVPLKYILTNVSNIKMDWSSTSSDLTTIRPNFTMKTRVFLWKPIEMMRVDDTLSLSLLSAPFFLSPRSLLPTSRNVCLPFSGRQRLFHCHWDTSNVQILSVCRFELALLVFEKTVTVSARKLNFKNFFGFFPGTPQSFEMSSSVEIC